MPERTRIAVVTLPFIGWGTVRQRWEALLPRIPNWECGFYHIEDFAQNLYFIARRRPNSLAKNVWRMLAGRKAVRAALRDGHRQVLVATVHYAPLLPDRPDLRYLVYGDSTPRQLAPMLPKDVKHTAFDEWAFRRLARPWKADLQFLCMSDWYRQGLLRDFGISEDRTHLLRNLVDTDLWKRSQTRTQDGPLRLVFMAGMFDRKGGHVLESVVRSWHPGEIECDFATAHGGSSSGNVRFHNGLKPDSPELISLVHRSDLLVLPTQADCSPNVVVEASAAGLPVIATRIGGIPEMVVDGQTGALLEEPSEDRVRTAISRYVAHREEVSSHGENARRFAEENFSLSRHVRDLQEIVSSPKGG